MSYCRWSSDKFQSDVYVYANVSGYWTTHVANLRIAEEYPHPDPYSYEMVSKTPNDEWTKQIKAYHEWLDTVDHKPFGLPHDGQTFNDKTPQDCAKTLRKLRDLGYRVPDGVIEELEAEEFDPVATQKIREEYETKAKELFEKYDKD